MAVSKRTRFEVLRRDDYTCRYCRATDNPLTIDHVTPVALGGSDKPENLVAACKDCNAGKSSASPDASLVADVAQDAIRWAKAIEVAATERAASKGKRDAYTSHFEHKWLEWSYGPPEDKQQIPWPADWKPTIWKFYALGLPASDIEDAITVACGNNKVKIDQTWRYFCGVCWRMLEDIDHAARSVVATSEASDLSDFDELVSQFREDHVTSAVLSSALLEWHCDGWGRHIDERFRSVPSLEALEV